MWPVANEYLQVLGERGTDRREKRAQMGGAVHFCRHGGRRSMHRSGWGDSPVKAKPVVEMKAASIRFKDSWDT